MFEILKKIYRNLLRIMPTKLALYLIYFRGYKKILNLKNPTYYGEKIQWLKLNGELEKLAKYVDKYEVRKYIERTIGKEYLFNVYGVFDDVNNIDFSILPEKFVLKCTNGSQAILICKDKKNFNIEKAKKIMKAWLNDDFYRIKKEFQYKNVKNRILVEEYMEDETGELRDYKFYCFNGEPRWYAIFSNRFTNKIIDTYDIEGNYLVDCKNGGKNIKTTGKINLDSDKRKKLIELSKKLSEIFTIVRVDFYIVKNKIYFGELTFTDGAGSDPIYPLEKYDKEFAKYIELKKVLLKEKENG